MASKNSPDPTSHSDPIPINSGNNNRFRQRSASDSSSASESDSVPPLSPSHSPSSSTTAVSFPSQFSSARVPLSPASPSASPIMSFFYGSPTSPNKSFFNRTPFEADDSSDPNQIKISAQARGLNPSWMPPRFSQHQHQAPPKHPIHPIDSQQERGIGILRRLSLSTPRVGIASKPMITTPQDQTGSTAPHASENVKQHDKVTSIGRPPGHHRRASTLSPGSPNKPRAPSPMGERILKGHYDGF